MKNSITQVGLIACTAMAMGSGFVAEAATISTFSFDGASGNEASFLPAIQPVGATVGSISRGSGLTPSGAGGAFSASGWTMGADLDPNDYYEFSISVDAGYVLDLNRIELDERRSGTGIRSWAIFSSLDSYGAPLATFAVPDDAGTRTNQGEDLGSAFDSLTGILSFRIYGFASESSAGTWRVDNIDLLGEISKAPVPPPISTPEAGSSLLLLSVALGGVFAIGRRQI